MSKSDNTQADHPLRETEQAAYHAYREWPVLLVVVTALALYVGTTPPASPAT